MFLRLVEIEIILLLGIMVCGMEEKSNLKCKRCNLPFEVIDSDFKLRQNVFICRKCGYVKIIKELRDGRFD